MGLEFKVLHFFLMCGASIMSLNSDFQLLDMQAPISYFRSFILDGGT
jgi:hypothetical protein